MIKKVINLWKLSWKMTFSMERFYLTISFNLSFNFLQKLIVFLLFINKNGALKKIFFETAYHKFNSCYCLLEHGQN